MAEVKPNSISYDVNYGVLDKYKMECLAAAREISDNLLKVGFKEVPESRGESVSLIRGHGMMLAFVVEGLGTLNRVAEEILEKTGRSYMRQIHRANFATIVNDLTACGAYPLFANPLISVGDEKYFADKTARADSVRGWQRACIEVGCAWGGGETQKLRDIVVPDSAVLGGAAMGFIKPMRRYIRGNIRPGDVIVIVMSSGVHANGVTLARDAAGTFDLRYDHVLPYGTTYGEALLNAGHVLYGPLTQAVLDAKLEFHYISNITGHAWSKLMRHPEPLTYVIKTLPEPQPVFRCIQEATGSSDRRMYETFNMGGGAAYYMPRVSIGPFFAVAGNLGYLCLEAGVVEKGPRQVILPIDDGVFRSEAYQVR
jgi:phosphoribosylformylglycinamidine cyclo-ligase